MRAAVISFTEHGQRLAETLAQGLSERGIVCRIWVKRKGASGDETDVNVVDGSLRAWTGEQFSVNDALIFIGAAGIAVRSIAPYVRSKKTDPAVVVLDEQGRHAISLLSGHIGGANGLTRLVAELTGAEAVITTATDLNGKFAVDEFAARRNLYLDSMETAKEIAARLVAGEPVGMDSAFPVVGALPRELKMGGEDLPVGFCIDVKRRNPFAQTLHLVPRCVTLGIGCRKGISQEAVEERVFRTLKEHGIFPESVAKIASIDLKKEEQALLALAERMEVPFETYSAEELERAESETGFSESAFVRSVTGTGNVCERAALLGAGTSRLLIPKAAADGVTVAAAMQPYTVFMED